MKMKFILLAVIVLMIAACKNDQPKSTINVKASFPPSFDFAKLNLKVLNSSINKKQGTMATLYGNDKALKAALADSGGRTEGEVFALVTWKQQDDPNWFGAKIPGDFQSVEFVRIMPPGSGHNNILYGCMEGKNLTPNSDTTLRQQRIKYILTQRPSVMP